MSVRQAIRSAFSLEEGSASPEEIRQSILSGAHVKGTNLCILVLAILIASIGLNMNSTAVIIGAMLISPLMGGIMAVGYGFALGDLRLSRRAFIGLLFQVIVCIVASTLYFSLSPISTAHSELLARTMPTVWDVLIAVCGGLAGIIGVTRKEKTNVIPGVAIATALMPPLVHRRLRPGQPGRSPFSWGHVPVLHQRLLHLREHLCGGAPHAPSPAGI